MCEKAYDKNQCKRSKKKNQPERIIGSIAKKMMIIKVGKNPLMKPCVKKPRLIAKTGLQIDRLQYITNRNYRAC
jgi:hypothetical protein